MNNVLKTLELIVQNYLKVWEAVCNIESPTAFKKNVNKAGACFTSERGGNR